MNKVEEILNNVKSFIEESELARVVISLVISIVAFVATRGILVSFLHTGFELLDNILSFVILFPSFAVARLVWKLLEKFRNKWYN